jgi:hypothetical protein
MMSLRSFLREAASGWKGVYIGRVFSSLGTSPLTQLHRVYGLGARPRASRSAACLRSNLGGELVGIRLLAQRGVTMTTIAKLAARRLQQISGRRPH